MCLALPGFADVVHADFQLKMLAPTTVVSPTGLHFQEASLLRRTC